MSFALLHLFAGTLAGVFFRVQTLFALALLALAEVMVVLEPHGMATVCLWAFAAETMLQLGYLIGIYARSVVARGELAFPTTKGTSGPSAR